MYVYILCMCIFVCIYISYMTYLLCSSGKRATFWCLRSPKDLRVLRCFRLRKL